MEEEAEYDAEWKRVAEAADRVLRRRGDPMHHHTFQAPAAAMPTFHSWSSLDRTVEHATTDTPPLQPAYTAQSKSPKCAKQRVDCTLCGRSYTVNDDGATRKHFCMLIAPPPETAHATETALHGTGARVRDNDSKEDSGEAAERVEEEAVGDIHMEVAERVEEEAVGDDIHVEEEAVGDTYVEEEAVGDEQQGSLPSDTFLQQQVRAFMQKCTMHTSDYLYDLLVQHYESCPEQPADNSLYDVGFFLSNEMPKCDKGDTTNRCLLFFLRAALFFAQHLEAPFHRRVSAARQVAELTNPVLHPDYVAASTEELDWLERMGRQGVAYVETCRQERRSLAHTSRVAWAVLYGETKVQSAATVHMSTVGLVKPFTGQGDEDSTVMSSKLLECAREFLLTAQRNWISKLVTITKRLRNDIATDLLPAVDGRLCARAEAFDVETWIDDVRPALPPVLCTPT